MTEAEWLACDDLAVMVNSSRVAGKWRKARLFACACVRQVWHLLRHEWARRATEAAECYIDGSLSPEQAGKAWGEMQDGFRLVNESGHGATGTDPGIHAALGASWAAVPLSPDHLMREGVGDRSFAPVELIQAAWYASTAEVLDLSLTSDQFDPDAGAGVRARQARILRDIVGDRFRSPSLDPDLRTASVTSLGQAAYDERPTPSGELNVARLTALADALEEAGCTDAHLLGHLRFLGPHVRGCWALDLILGKQ